RIAALALVGRPRPVDPIRVTLAWPDAGHIAVPAERRAIGEPDRMLPAALVEEAQVHPVGHLRVRGEAGALSVPVGTQWKGLSRPDFNSHVVTSARAVPSAPEALAA